MPRLPPRSGSQQQAGSQTAAPDRQPWVRGRPSAPGARPLSRALLPLRATRCSRRPSAHPGAPRATSPCLSSWGGAGQVPRCADTGIYVRTV